MLLRIHQGKEQNLSYITINLIIATFEYINAIYHISMKYTIDEVQQKGWRTAMQ